VVPVSDYSKPYTVDVSYTEKEYVTHTKTVLSDNFPLSAFTYKTIDFPLSEGQNVKIKWSSSTQIALFSMMKQSTYDSFYQSLVLKVGAAAALAIISGGLLAPAIAAGFAIALPDLLKSIGSVDYYSLNSVNDSRTMNLVAGPYKVVVFSFGSSGSASVDISYDYQVLEDVVKHRTETHYENKMVSVWQWLFIK
jgi:hypothetical protein